MFKFSFYLQFQCYDIFKKLYMSFPENLVCVLTRRNEKINKKWSWSLRLLRGSYFVKVRRQRTNTSERAGTTLKGGKHHYQSGRVTESFLLRRIIAEKFRGWGCRGFVVVLSCLENRCTHAGDGNPETSRAERSNFTFPATRARSLSSRLVRLFVPARCLAIRSNREQTKARVRVHRRRMQSHVASDRGYL